MTPFKAFCVFILLVQSSLAQSPARVENYVLLKPTIPAGVVDQDTILTYFSKADRFMDLDQYDSAEYWLGRVGEKLEFKKPGLFNYYYHSRQSEVFYYNDLLQLGLQQANRALQIARTLKDSLLTADAYNFLGLFHLNLGRYEDAKTYLLRGLGYIPFAPDYNGYLSLSMPHHLHGNLGEAYMGLREFEKALEQFRISFQKALTYNAPRAQALARISAGEALFMLKNYKEATRIIQEGLNKALEAGDLDVALLGYGTHANLEVINNRKENAYALLDKGFDILWKNANLNPFYTLLFLKKAAGLYSLFQDFPNIARSQQKIIDIETTVRKKYNFQIESVLSVGLKNENRLLQFEIQEARQKQTTANIRLAGTLLVMTLVILLGLIYRNSLKQKLAMARMREKISRNLHDDIGATISSLHIFSSLAQSTLYNRPEKTSEMLGLIREQSKTLMENMNDMVWSMKEDQQDSMTLGTRIKNFGAELLTARNIHCRYQIDEDVFALFKSFDARRHILLIMKEAMNNMAKYSEATEAAIQLQRFGREAVIEIQDNGKGFDPALVKNGNGLNNMESRVNDLGGYMKVDSSCGQGTRLLFYIPVP